MNQIRPVNQVAALTAPGVRGHLRAQVLAELPSVVEPSYPVPGRGHVRREHVLARRQQRSAILRAVVGREVSQRHPPILVLSSCSGLEPRFVTVTTASAPTTATPPPTTDPPDTPPHQGRSQACTA